MSKDFYVYSTLAATTAYVIWQEGDGGQMVEKHRIVVKGGSGIANKNIITPIGVATRITEKDAELLAEHDLFKRHQAKGYVRIEPVEKDPEKVVTSSGMKTRDVSAPLVPSDFKANEAQPSDQKGD